MPGAKVSRACRNQDSQRFELGSPVLDHNACLHRRRRSSVSCAKEIPVTSMGRGEVPPSKKGTTTVCQAASGPSDRNHLRSSGFGGFQETSVCPRGARPVRLPPPPFLDGEVEDR